jgi:outer membrane protein assembly factor BamA
MLLSSLVLALVSTAPATATISKPVTKAGTVDGIALPLLGFNSDFGMAYGVVGGMYLYGEGREPYQHALGAQVFFSTSGVQNHSLRYDGPRLLGPLRVEARFEYKREFRSPFYGAGNRSAPEFTGDAKDVRYNYDKGSPGAWLRLRGHPFGEDHPLQVYGGYSWRYTRVSPYEASMLAQMKPLGIEGGPTGQLMLGALWDTRDNESDPSTGGVEEIAIRFSGHTTGSRYRYTGVTLAERRYFQLGSRFIFAQRLSLDMLFGEVPFFEWSTTGGVNFTEGVGGMSSVRGIERNRFAGNIKVFSNSELRFHALDLRVLGQPMKLGAAAFMDIGRVWHPGVSDGAWHEWHPGVGAGLRVTRRAAVIRLDYALSTENGGQRLYMNYGHMF